VYNNETISDHSIKVLQEALKEEHRVNEATPLPIEMEKAHTRVCEQLLEQLRLEREKEEERRKAYQAHLPAHLRKPSLGKKLSHEQQQQHTHGSHSTMLPLSITTPANYPHANGTNPAALSHGNNSHAKSQVTRTNTSINSSPASSPKHSPTHSRNNSRQLRQGIATMMK
jgi:hypothetical protein